MGYLAIKDLGVQLSEIVKSVVDSREDEIPLKFAMDIVIKVYGSKLLNQETYYSGFLEIEGKNLTRDTTRISLIDFDWNRFSKDEKFLEKIDLTNLDSLYSRFFIRIGDHEYIMKCQKISDKIVFLPYFGKGFETKLSLHTFAYIDKELFYEFFPKADLNSKVTNSKVSTTDKKVIKNYYAEEKANLSRGRLEAAFKLLFQNQNQKKKYTHREIAIHAVDETSHSLNDPDLKREEAIESTRKLLSNIVNKKKK